MQNDALVKLAEDVVDEAFGEEAVEEAEEAIPEATDVLWSGMATGSDAVEETSHMKRRHAGLLVMLHSRHGSVYAAIGLGAVFGLMPGCGEAGSDISGHEDRDVYVIGTDLVL